MRGSIIKNKNFLAIGSQVDLLKMVREKIMSECPECSFDMATTLKNGRQLMIMFSYNLIILDMMNILWRNLISLSASRNFPVLALSNINTSDEAINQSNTLNGMIIRTTLPRNNLNKIVPTIEEVLKCENASGWRRDLEKPWRFLMNFWSRLSVSTKTSGPVSLRKWKDARFQRTRYAILSQDKEENHENRRAFLDRHNHPFRPLSQ